MIEAWDLPANPYWEDQQARQQRRVEIVPAMEIRRLVDVLARSGSPGRTEIDAEIAGALGGSHSAG